MMPSLGYVVAGKRIWNEYCSQTSRRGKCLYARQRLATGRLCKTHEHVGDEMHARGRRRQLQGWMAAELYASMAVVGGGEL